MTPLIENPEGFQCIPNWQTFASHQRRSATGCIPTGYEILLRAAGATGIDFATFQDEFDLERPEVRTSELRNNFGSVADAVVARYPYVRFAERVFDDGAEKVRAIDDLVAAGQPCLISLALSPGGGWHIMLVVGTSPDELLLLNRLDADGTAVLTRASKINVAWRHDNWRGGKEIATLEQWQDDGPTLSRHQA